MAIRRCHCNQQRHPRTTFNESQSGSFILCRELSEWECSSVLHAALEINNYLGRKINVQVIRVTVILTVAFIIAAVLLVPSTPAANRDKGSVNQTGQAAFKGNCVGCHGSDGAGTSLGKSMQAPDLRSQEVQKKSDAELVQTVAEGKQNMPSFKQILAPDQVQAVVEYVRELSKTRP